jgi:hypothetical protein
MAVVAVEGLGVISEEVCHSFDPNSGVHQEAGR